MTDQDIEKLIKEQNKYFNSGLTRSYESRLVSLKALKRAILSIEGGSWQEQGGGFHV